MYKYITFSISISIISWLVGMLLNAFVKKSTFYTTHLSNLNFVTAKNANKLLGLPAFKWAVKNSFFKFFNQKLKLEHKPKRDDLLKLRAEMTSSEIDHLIGFLFVSIFALQKIFIQNHLFALIIMLFNVLLNLYPSLLQQENKRRIDAFLARY